MKKSLTLLFMWAIVALHAATLPSGFTEKRLATGLDPTGLTVLPDGRIFITIKSGKILVVKSDSLLSVPLLTIPNVDNWNERGLQTVIADPNFASNHYIYVYYCYKNPTTNSSNNRVSRFMVMGDVADPNSEQVLINFDNLGSSGWHNGGGMVYALDGKLYISTGENSVANKAQALNTLLGKIVRINPDGSIPTDNPFYNTLSGQFRAIYALGFRNPFKLNLQPGTGKIYANEVGQGTWEEINHIVAGGNYGWPAIEGKRTTQTAPDNYQDPVYTYSHSGGPCSITGGHFYNSSFTQFPSTYQGKFFFGDYCAGWIRYVDPANNHAVSNFASGIDRPLDIDVDSLGNLYYIARGGLGGGSDEDNTSSNEGELWRITYTGIGDVRITVDPSNKTVATGAKVSFVVGASGTAPLTYRWQRNGIDIPNATSQIYSLATVALSDSGARFRAIVSNGTSADTSANATLSVVNNATPVAQILTPIANTLYEAGTVLSFSGIGTDTDTDSLPASAYTWKIDFHHDVHAHPALDPISGFKSGTFYIPNEGEVSDTVWYRIYLTITDALGAKSTVYRDVYPRKVNITLESNPSPLPLLLNGSQVSTPHTFTSVVGIKHSLEAPYTAVQNADTLSFTHWDYSTQSLQTLVAPRHDTTITATYVPVSTASLGVVADAYVRGGANRNTRYGVTDPNFLLSKTETNPDLQREIYLRFDVGAYTDIYSAKLRLFGTRNSAEDTPIAIQVFAVPDTLWQEQTLTFANKPTALDSVLAQIEVGALPTAPQVYEWNLSGYIRTARAAGRRQLTLKLSNPVISSAYLSFNSKEASTNKPQLLITYPKVVVGLKDQELDPSVSIFPNPVQHAIQVNSNASLQSVQVLNLQGQSLYTQSLQGQSQTQLDLTGLENGLYQLLLTNSNGRKTIKTLIVQK